MEGIFGSIFFEIVGAIVKWLFNFIYSLIKGNERESFGEILKGKEDEQYHEVFMGGVSNILVGVVFIFLIVFLLIFLGV